MNGIGNFGKNDKVYFAHLSEDQNHDPVFTIESLKEMVSEKSVPKTYVIRSDNAPHFKCAQCFHDLQDVSAASGATIIRVYGTVGHRKREIYSVEGHVKNVIRKSIDRSNLKCE